MQIFMTKQANKQRRVGNNCVERNTAGKVVEAMFEKVLSCRGSVLERPRLRLHERCKRRWLSFVCAKSVVAIMRCYGQGVNGYWSSCVNQGQIALSSWALAAANLVTVSCFRRAAAGLDSGVLTGNSPVD